MVMYRFYEIEYIDGLKEEIDLSKVCCYEISNNHYSFTGTGVDSGSLVVLVEQKKPIVIGIEIRKPSIEKIINTEKIKSITLKFK